MDKSLVVAVLLVLVVLPVSAGAALYTYVDERGVTHYTNVPVDGRMRLKKGAVVHSSSSRSRQKHDWYRSRSRLNSGAQGSITAHTMHHHINRAATVHKVDPSLIKAIIKTESNFNPLAVSTQGAQGLMQLMPGTARDLNVQDPFDVWQNIEGGTRYFRWLLDSYHGNVELSLAAYNAGPGRVKPFGKIPRIPETRAYVSKVLRYYAAYKKGIAQLTSISIRNLVTQ